MRKVKNALLIFLAVLLLAAGGLLPMAAAHMQDQATANVVQYEDIEALQLKLEETVGMTFPEKLHLLVNGTGVELTDSENTRLKESDILETAYSALKPYMELMFGWEPDNDYLDYYPVKVCDENDPSRFTYYWWVYLSWDHAEGDYTTLILDDETGKLLGMEMYDPAFDLDSTYLSELNDTLAGIYLSELDLITGVRWKTSIVEPEQEWNANKTGLSSLNQFVVNGRGEVTVEICSYATGFYIILG